MVVVDEEGREGREKLKEGKWPGVVRMLRGEKKQKKILETHGIGGTGRAFRKK